MASVAAATSAPTAFDWTTAVKPLLGATYGNFQSYDLVKLAKCIESSRDQIMNHEPEFEPFYSLFVALATHHLCSNSTSIPKANLPTVVNACGVLAEFILNRLETPHAQCQVMPKQFVLLVKSLCKGLGFLQRADVITLAALMKSSQLPPHIRATIGAEKVSEDESTLKSRKKDRGIATAPPRAPARQETVLTNLLDFLSVSVPPDSVVERTKDSKPTTPTDTSKDVKEQFISECMQHLVRLNAGSILIDVCLKLPFLARYNLMFRDMMRGESPFANINVNECQGIFDSYSSFLNDIVMVSRVVALPLLEPLTPERLAKLCSLGCTCLLAACTVVIAYNSHTPKADADAGITQEIEAFTNNVVEKSLVIFSTILSSIQSSHNIGGTQLQNMRALGAWCISSALNHMLKAFDMNGAIVCIAQQLLTLLQPLFVDLKTDTGKTETALDLNVNSVLTPWQRFDYIDNRCKLVPVLLTIGHDSFLRGVDMMRENRTVVKTTVSESLGVSKTQDFEAELDASQAQSVPNTPSESDSEPLLGSWLEDILSSVPQLVDSAVKQSAGILHSGLRRRTTAASESSTILGVKEDAHTYTSLSINCLRMLNDDLLYGYRTDLLKKSISSCWTEREIGYLATLIRTVDRQIETGNAADDSLSEFKSTLTKFVHNLIANGLLSETIEVCLLAKLDIGVGEQDSASEWPLNLSPCLSGILCQVLLLRQNKERDESGHSETGSVIVRIWHRVLMTLRKNAFKEHDFIDIVDINVEHLQVLLSLFHSLPLMQKKAVLLDVCLSIKDIVHENRKSKHLNNNASSHFTRLLLIFEYLLRNFYEPPQALLQQLKKNIFPIQSQTSMVEEGDGVVSFTPSPNIRAAAVHFSCGEIEEIYRAEVPIMQQVKMRPFFYNLAPSFSTLEVPKLDGLAATFIQNAFNYDDFYDCCCELTCFYDGFRPSDESAAFQRAVLRYCCALVWRILKLLPPSVGFLADVDAWTLDNVSDTPLWKSRVFLLLTGIRLSEAAFAGWMKDGLIKQGQNADQVEELVQKVSHKNGDSTFILRLIGESIEKMKRNWRLDALNTNGGNFPSFVDMVYVDLLLCRAHSLLESNSVNLVSKLRSDTSALTDGDLVQSKKQIPTDAIPIQSFKAVLVDFITAAHTLLIERAMRSTSDPFPSTPAARNAALKLMSLCGSNPHQTSEVATVCWYTAHVSLRGSVEFWNRRNLNEFPSTGSWRNEYANNFAPTDCYLDAVYSAHVGGLANDWLASQLITVKRIMHTSFHLLADTISWHPGILEKKEVDQLMAPVLFDVLTSHLSDFAFSVLTTVHGAKEHEILQECLYRQSIPTAYEIIVEHTMVNNGAFDSKVSEKCLTLMEKALDVSAGRKTLVYVLTSRGDVSSLLRTAVQEGVDLGFTTALVRLLGKIFQTSEMVPEEKEFKEFCHNISKSFSFEPELLQQLLNNVFVAKEESDLSSPDRFWAMTECCTFLEAVARSANRALSCDSIETARLLLENMIPVMTSVLSMDYRSNTTDENAGRGPFAQLFFTLARFASVGRGLGHRDLLKAANEWMTLCTKRMSADEALNQIKSGEANATLRVLSEAMCTILNYLNELMNLFNQRQGEVAATTYDSDFSSGEQETDGMEDFAAQAEDDESGGEESDDDQLDSKLCTFTATQKEFMNQHWYHCHTCGMVDGEGVCTVCAKVCHKGHDLSYSKYGSFFCDCGAKQEPNCQALAKRTKFKATSKAVPVAADVTAAEAAPTGVRRSRVKGWQRSPTEIEGQKSVDEQKKFILFYGDNRDREELRKELVAAKNGIVKNLLDFLEKIVPAVSAAAESYSSIGNYAKLRQSLRDLQDCDDFRCDTVETIATLIGGSQENAFENVNVKSAFGGDQGQTIKQLLNNHILHRTCLACASSQNKRKQFLVVVHDRCKVAIMHLSSFLKQVENGKKKPTLSRSTSDSFPFTILSVAENPISEDYVAVCGLKECVIVTLSQLGSISDRLTLTLGLDVGNFLIKALWLPGSASEIALVTADFVRIYDLAKSSTRPEYDFLLPAGKIRDATFVCRDTKSNGDHGLERYLLLMTSTGYVYAQSLGPHCHNTPHGSFYITDVLEMKHDELEESSGNISGGGVSIYYSHILQLLFTSYTSGKNVFCSLNHTASGLGTVKKLNFITWKSSQKSVAAQALYRLHELQGHGGVLVGLTHTGQTPVVLFIRPRSILAQEITMPPKAKVLDAILCRNVGFNEESQSCVLLLCEDGSVRTVSINKELTNFWVKKPSSFRFPVVPSACRSRSKRTWKTDRTDVAEFPVDFFEQCQQLMDVEFGGSDLLQIYNVLQLRNRLQTTNLYVACAKTGGFQMEILNRESGMVICGVRIELGKHSCEKAPSFIEIFGRRRTVALTHARWIDLPFSKDESISTGNKLSILFGPTTEASGVCIIDSIKLYGKTKEAFGWPDDVEEDLPAIPSAPELRAISTQASMTANDDLQQNRTPAALVRDMGDFERSVKSAFETLAATFLTFNDLTDFHGPSIGLATNVLTTPAHPDTIRSAKLILRLLSSSKTEYYANKDSFILKYLMVGLKRTEANSDPELFAFLVSLARSVATSRAQSLTTTVGGAGTDGGLLKLLPESFWRLRDLVSPRPSICPIGSVEIENVDGLVHAMVELLHAHCVADISLTPLVVKSLIKFLLCENLQIAIACRQAICWIYRRKLKKKRVAPTSVPAKLSTIPKSSVGATASASAAKRSSQQSRDSQQHPPPFELVTSQPLDPIPPNALLVEEDADAELDPDGVDQVYEVHADGDEEAMMELAIALSLQDQAANVGAVAVANVADNSNNYPSVSVQESIDGGHMSDTTGSGLSDEEGSTAATEGSTLRVSPSEERPPTDSATGAASDSGGSGAESGSGRSSNDGESAASSTQRQLRGSASSLPPPSQTEANGENKNKNHKLLLTVLDCLIDSLPELDNLNGIYCISYMQVITSLLNSFDCTEAAERKMVMKLLDAILSGLDFSPEAAAAFCKRSPRSEVTLLKLRFITVLLSRSKGRSKQQLTDADAFICSYTAGALVKRGVLDYCLSVLKTLLQQTQAVEIAQNGAKVLALRSESSPPDLAPFFLRPYVKEHSRDVFESYTQLVTEMAMRLPYQMKKVADMCRGVISPPNFEPAWNSVLCEFLRSEQSSFVKKHIRKLFMFICGSKEKYRQMRDVHSLDFDLKFVQSLCSPASSGGELSAGRHVTLDYGTLNIVMDHLKSCCDIALNRAGNWQKYCSSNTEMFCYLIQLSIMVDDNIAATILTLLNTAICVPESKEAKKKNDSRRQEEVDKFRFSDTYASTLAELLLSEQRLPLFITCLRRYLFECNTTERRWQMHGFVKALFGCTDTSAQQRLLDVLWRDLWPDVPLHGRKAVQFVDLLGYFTLTLAAPQRIASCAANVLALLKSQNQMLSQHTNANVYNALASLLEFDGYYLESNPCLVCNNPEVPMTNLKLSSIKMDARFTTSSQILKLVGSHEISKITLKISEIRRTKMVKRLSLYYCNKSLQSAVELKNRPDLWTLAKRFNLAQNQQELKMEFAVPIVACNLVMDYSEFYDTPLTASEMMHCPRCSASVPAHPGVCNNCGENVYQCHKCRAINYDERDPFLCNACGYSKYGKFDYTLTARPVAGVEPIETEEDRKKVCNLINTLLEKADQIYRQLQANRQQIEAALGRISGQDLSADDASTASPLTVNAATGQLASTGAMTFVTKNIQQVALKYNRDCRTSFDELSKVVQKIIANRAELVEYDRRLRETMGLPPGTEKLRMLQSSPKCFGCAAATAQQCILLIRGMTSSAAATSKLITSQKELMKELIDVAVKQSSARARQAARELVCSIINDQEEATDMVCNHITDKVTRALSEPSWSTTVVTSLVQVELHLLAASLQLMDRCWERRLRCAMDLFMKSTASPSGAMVEAITMPLLQMLQTIIFPPPFVSEKLKGKSLAEAASVAPAVNDVRVSMLPWLGTAGVDSSASCQSYNEWLTGLKPTSTVKGTSTPSERGTLAPESWLERALFCPNSIQLRVTAAAIFKQICATAPMRKALVLDLLTKHLKQISELGDRAHEFVSLYQSLIEEEQWKVYVSVHGILPQISALILKEIETLSGLENSTLATDIAQGYTIKVLTDVLISIVEIEKVRKRWKSQLLSSVLHSYLAVRSIVVQRTKLIDDAQSKLLQLLELLTTGTESETKEFMVICVETVKKCPPDDVRTPVFIFERLCSIIYPEEKEVGEFLINIEKDPAQEDFLQGRMAGNPYNCNDTGMGPLMRDIKTKICRDCELFSLLEDDTGMELLVNGKIISLDLPVVEVYKKVWQPQHNGEAMLVVYRMRGLLGDATEEFIETLAPKKGEKINEEEAFRLSGVMSECGGIEVMLDRLTSVKTVVHASPLLSVLLNLFEHCVKVKRNRIKLLEPDLSAVSKFLACLKLILSTKDPALISFVEKIFSILDRVITEANELPEDEFLALFSKTETDKDFEYLLNLVVDDQSVFIGSIKEALLRTLPNLSLGSDVRMQMVIDYFAKFVSFDSYDMDPSPRASAALDSFCALTKGVLHSNYGHELKQRFIKAGFLDSATKYLTEHCPPLFKIGLTIDSPDWKEFLSRPSLKYVLRLLAGISRGHEPSQTTVAKECIPIIHRLEQVSSEEHLGTLAEAVMEALRENPSVAKRIIEVREETRAKKKQMAMAMRQKQLGEMGMKIGEKGLVRVESGVLKDADLREESGLICSICQEGYTAAPQKALGIYTYSKRVNSDDYETKARKTPAYSTVTHFNVIHLECHQSAVRSARGRDEWESAMLHNANTRCNGLLPFWGPNVSESEYAGHLSRHNQYIQEHTSVGDIGFSTSLHDLKLLLNRFSNEKSFADESGGGGRSSNIHLIPYLIQVSLYVLISSNQMQNQSKALQNYFALRPADWVGLAFESDGHLYYCVLSFLMSPPNEWNRRRLDLLKRLIVTAQARQVARGGATKSLPDTAAKDYVVYKSYLLFFAMVNGFYKHLFSEVKCENVAEWPTALQTYVRQNDSKLLESTSKLLKFFEEDLLPCETFTEFLEVCGLLTDVQNPDEFLAATLASVS